MRDEAFLIDAALAANGEEFRAKFALLKFQNFKKKLEDQVRSFNKRKGLKKDLKRSCCCDS